MPSEKQSFTVVVSGRKYCVTIRFYSKVPKKNGQCAVSGMFAPSEILGNI